MKDLYYAAKLDKVSRGLEMSFHTSFQTQCYNFGQDHEKEHSFKLDLILSAAQIPSTHWLRISIRSGRMLSVLKRLSTSSWISCGILENFLEATQVNLLVPNWIPYFQSPHSSINSIYHRLSELTSKCSCKNAGLGGSNLLIAYIKKNLNSLVFSALSNLSFQFQLPIYPFALAKFNILFGVDRLLLSSKRSTPFPQNLWLCYVKCLGRSKFAEGIMY